MVPDNLLVTAAAFYGFQTDNCQFISDSTNQIYWFRKDEKPYILRFSQRPPETVHQTQAEMDWLFFLANKDINVSLPLTDKDGNLVSSVTHDGQNWILTAFEMAEGQPWNRNNPALWNDAIFESWGKTVGDIHRLSKTFAPANETDIRFAFTGREALDMSVQACTPIWDAAEAVIAEMLALPKDADSYGLIHYDAHPWNFLIDDNNNIHIFDFDDSVYG